MASPVIQLTSGQLNELVLSLTVLLFLTVLVALLVAPLLRSMFDAAMRWFDRTHWGRLMEARTSRRVLAYLGKSGRISKLSPLKLDMLRHAAAYPADPLEVPHG